MNETRKISIKNISAGYGNKAFLQNISQEIFLGETTVILGPNGCGKSTLLKCIARQLPLMKGEISLCGTDIQRIKPKDYAQQLSYLKQNREFPSISAESLVLHGRFPYLGFPRQYSEKDKRIAKEAMLKTGVWDLRHKLVSELSGGECQKVYLAMALAQSTEILLLDEPTTFLDIQVQLEFLSLLKALKKDGKTILLVLHDLNAALKISDRLLLMKEGAIVSDGKPEALLESGAIDQVFQIRTKLVRLDGELQVFILSHV